MADPVSVVILAAGLGTRMRSRLPKVLHRAGGRTLVEHVVHTALQITSADHIFVVVGYQGEKVRAALSQLGVQFVEQTEQKGTGHAVMVGRDALQNIPGHLIVLYGDCPLVSVPTLRGLIEAQESSPASAATILTAIMEDPTGYGRVIRDGEGRPTMVVEQKAGTPEQLAVREANMGLYCYNAPLFWKHVGEIQPNNPVKEYYLTDMVEIFHRAGHAVKTFRLEDASEVIGINNRVELANVDRLLRSRKNRQLMEDGVTIQNPDTVSIDSTVQIGMDSIIEPFVQLSGNTSIGENCHIGAGSIIADCEIGDGVTIFPFSSLSASRIGKGAEVGPYARMRMGAEVAPGAHVGNFVELKKTQLGSGSKAMHLAYLGDSQIGEKVNIGAGTITCNYDGAKKHATQIGDGAFVGSNSTLVAPVEIGPGAYLGAGSVVTQAVPADALALGRSRQVNKLEWAKKRREKQAKK